MLLLALLATLGAGLYRAWSDGRFRGAHPVRGVATEASEELSSAVDPVQSTRSVLAGTAYDEQRGSRATLLQFSSAFCAPCRATRQTLAHVSARVPGVVHVEVDAEHHLDLVRRLGVLRTPTTLVLDGHGCELSRAAGAPRAEQVLAAVRATPSGGHLK